MLGSLCDTLDVYDYNDVTSRVKCYKVSSLGMLFQVGLGRKKQNRREKKQVILVQDGLSASLSASIHRFNQQKVKTNWKKLNQYWMWTDSFSLHYCINNTGLQFFTLHFRGFRHHKMSDDDLEHTRKYVQILHKYYAILCGGIPASADWHLWGILNPLPLWVSRDNCTMCQTAGQVVIYCPIQWS